MSKHALTEGSYEVLKFLKETAGQSMTQNAIADAMGIERKSITGKINALCKEGRGFAYRQEETTVVDGKKVVTKRVVITDAGMAYDHESAIREDEADAEALRLAKEAAKIAKANATEE